MAKDYPPQHANADGWTDWISPTDIDMYGLQCCDCGLKHEMQFRVMRNKAYTDGEHWFADPVPVEEGYHVAFRMKRDAASVAPSAGVACEVPEPTDRDEIKRILQRACDRDWKDETLYQTAIIAANAIYWRDREIEALKEGRKVRFSPVSATLATWPRHVLEAVHSALDKQLGDSDIGHLVNDEDILNHQPVQWAATEISKMLATVGPTGVKP
jgi:hypothetical protein